MTSHVFFVYVSFQTFHFQHGCELRFSLHDDVSVENDMVANGPFSTAFTQEIKLKLATETILCMIQRWQYHHPRFDFLRNG